MAIISVEDIYGEFDCMIFNKLYETIAESLTTERIVHIFGRVSIRVGDKPIIIVEKIDYLDEKDSLQQAPKQEDKVVFDETKKEEKIEKIYLKFDINNAELVSEIGDILAGYAGKSPVFVQHEKRLYNLGVTANASNSLIAEISGVIGAENIKII